MFVFNLFSSITVLLASQADILPYPDSSQSHTEIVNYMVVIKTFYYALVGSYLSQRGKVEALTAFLAHFF